MSTIRLLSAPEARAAIPDLCEVLADCVNGGASVGFMQPYGPADAELYWQSVADSVETGATLLFVAEIEGKVVGTVDIRERHLFADVSAEHANSIIAKLNRSVIKGHKVKVANDGDFGGYQAIMRNAEGVYFGASESRKDGAAQGY